MLNSRVQNIVFTLDKVKLCLRVPGQLQAPPLRPLADAEVAAHLAGGERSVALRAARKAAELLADERTAKAVGGASR